MKKTLLLIGLAFVVLLGVTLVRTFTFVSDQHSVELAPEVAIREGAAERLAGSLRLPTISHEDPSAFDPAAFQSLHAYLASTFPRVHALLQRETVATHSLLYTWQGTNPSLKPILFMAHLDVVPVEPGT